MEGPVTEEMQAYRTAQNHKYDGEKGAGGGRTTPSTPPAASEVNKSSSGFNTRGFVPFSKSSRVDIPGELGHSIESPGPDHEVLPLCSPGVVPLSTVGVTAQSIVFLFYLEARGKEYDPCSSESVFQKLFLSL